MNYKHVLVGLGAGALIYYLGSSESAQQKIQEMGAEPAPVVLGAAVVGAGIAYFAASKLLSAADVAPASSVMNSSISSAANGMEEAGPTMLGVGIDQFVSGNH